MTRFSYGQKTVSPKTDKNRKKNAHGAHFWGIWGAKRANPPGSPDPKRTRATLCTVRPDLQDRQGSPALTNPTGRMNWTWASTPRNQPTRGSEGETSQAKPLALVAHPLCSHLVPAFFGVSCCQPSPGPYWYLDTCVHIGNSPGHYHGATPTDRAPCSDTRNRSLDSRNVEAGGRLNKNDLRAVVQPGQCRAV